MSHGKEKTSPVWDYFWLKGDDNSKAVCGVCMSILSRGSSNAKQCCTSALTNHLRAKHPIEYAQYESKKQAITGKSQHSNDSDFKQIKESLLPQLNNSPFMEPMQAWSQDRSLAHTVDRSIGEMIALDLQKFSVVEDVGFVRLINKLEPRYKIPSQTFFAACVIPEIYRKVCQKIADEVRCVEKMTLTMDLWTSENTVKSFLNLTAHWLSSSMARQGVLLHCEAFEGSHTGAKIGLAFQEILKKWEIPHSKVHVILRDNAENMRRAFRDVDCVNVGCFAHSLQLCVNDGLFTQRPVTDMVSHARNLVSHFKQSNSATYQLHTLQKNLGFSQMELIQDVAKSWISTFFMLERLVQQRQPVSLYCAEDDNVKMPNLSASQWLLAENILSLLAPFVELTSEIASPTSSISLVIPALRVLSAYLKSVEVKGTQSEHVKAELLRVVSVRFQDMEEMPVYSVATGIDPRFKLRFFSTDVAAHNVKCTLHSTALKHFEEDPSSFTCPSTSSQSESQLGVSNASHHVNGQTPKEETSDDADTFIYSIQVQNSESQEGEPLCKKRTLPCGVWAYWDSVVQQTGDGGVSQSISSLDSELSIYLSEQLLAKNQDPLKWWQTNSVRFPGLAKVANVYLAAPPNRVDSEKVFSTSRDIYSEHHCALPDNVEQLVFLKLNLPHTEFMY